MNLTPAVEVSIQVKDSRSPSAIRRIIREVEDAEQLKPKNCDCSCFTIQPVDANTKTAPKEEVISKDTISKTTEIKAEPKVEPKKEAVKKETKPATKKSTSQKKSTPQKKKKPVYKGRLAKR